MNRWIEAQQTRGYDLENLIEFRKCEGEVRAIVGAFHSDEMTDGLRELSDAALTEHRNGETAEFV